MYLVYLLTLDYKNQEAFQIILNTDCWKNSCEINDKYELGYVLASSSDVAFSLFKFLLPIHSYNGDQLFPNNVLPPPTPN